MTEKASDLYVAMSQLKDVEKQAAHKGLPLEQVGLRQQQRHTKEIRY